MYSMFCMFVRLRRAVAPITIDANIKSQHGVTCVDPHQCAYQTLCVCAATKIYVDTGHKSYNIPDFSINNYVHFRQSPPHFEIGVSGRRNAYFSVQHHVTPGKTKSQTRY